MATTLRYLTPEEVRAWRPEGAIHLRVELRDDRSILSATIKRVFPLSRQSEYLSLQDGAGKEVGIIRSLDGMDSETRSTLQSHLDRRYFTPVISAITELRQEAGMWKFSVETQRGSADFYVRNWRDSAAEISPNRWHIHSVDGGRFEITHLEALDARSLRLMDQLL